MPIELYNYQKEDVEFSYGKPGILNANEMGTGKTVEALAEIKQAFDGGLMKHFRVLVIAGKTSRIGWERHCNLMVPDFPTYLLDNRNANEILLEYRFGIIITHWSILRNLADGLSHFTFDFIIADEAHRAKNRKTQQRKALKKIRGTYKRALTGTPIVNRPDELWSLLNWLYPREYTSYWKFFEAYCAYWKHPQHGYKIYHSPRNEAHLRRRIEPIYFRREKEVVFPDMPEKYYTPIDVDLLPKQQKAYGEMKGNMIAWVDSQDGEAALKAPTILAQLTRLRQFSVAFARLEEGEVHLSEPSAKLDALMEILQDTDKPVVVFSQFRQALLLAEARVAKAGISHRTMHGGTPYKDRKEYVEGFQRGEFQVFLAMTQSGGEGIDLYRASTVIFLDRSWSPAQNLQAEDRLHRHGQQNAVQVMILRAKGTVDEAVEKKLALKWEHIRRIIG